MNRAARISRIVFWALVTAIFAAIAHVGAVLLMPVLATRDAGHILRNLYADSALHLLPDPLLARLVSDPAIVAGVCSYNLADGPLRVKTDVSALEFLSISFHQPDGTSFFALTDSAASKRNIDILLVTDNQLQAIEAEDNPDEPVPELRLSVPETKGFVLVRSLVQRPDERSAAEQRVRAVTCATDTSELPEN